MKFPLVFVFLFLVPGNVLGKYVNYRDDLTYDDLVQTNVTCAAYKETCKNEGPFQGRQCSCDSDCAEFGTCCIDSPYRDNSVPMVECRNVAPSDSKPESYFLVSRCPPEVEVGSVWKDLCEKKWDGDDDMMKLVPVSSLDTFVTYKNYYCFKCHEDSDKFLSWDLRIQSNSVDEDRVSEDFSFTYDKERQRWIATTGDEYVLEDIHLSFPVPAELSVLPESCTFVLFSDCDDSWRDEDTREKCGGYTAIVYSTYNVNNSVSFKNPHCALCNFEQVENIVCFIAAGFGISSEAPKQRFSFAHLLNIHREDTDESETAKCGENQLWDPYGKKCRRIACAIPGYVVREGRCTRP